ncbi:MAG: hypothetical protein IT557_03510 [Alphaproteobacteria bacterium]|nr:hypothetical protein [Alphaproteobacteria bacterium]
MTALHPPPAAPAAPSLADAIARLEAVLEAENAHLAAHDLAAATALLAEKQAAVGALEAARKAEAAQAPQASLRGATARLDALATENARLLARMLAAQRALIRTLAEAAFASVTPPAGYGATGARPGTRIGAAALAVSRSA